MVCPCGRGNTLVGRTASACDDEASSVRKRWLYEAAGVPEYLIVDPDEQVGLLVNLRYEEARRVEWGALLTLLGGRLTVTVG